MDKNFQKYIRDLAMHQGRKTMYLVQNPRDSILVTSGLHLNWLGDFFANPNIKWIEKELPIEKIKFTGTNPEFNKILLEKCERSPIKFRELFKKDEKVKKLFMKYALKGEEKTILVRKDLENPGYYKVLGGMHRMIGIAMSNKKTVKTYVPINEEKFLPYCEPHVIYDLIRGYIRHAQDKEGEKELYYSLKLLKRTYGNVEKLLKERFNEKWVFEKDVQRIIKKVLTNK